jgi:hypothetical protein
VRKTLIEVPDVLKKIINAVTMNQTVDHVLRMIGIKFIKQQVKRVKKRGTKKYNCIQLPPAVIMEKTVDEQG